MKVALNEKGKKLRGFSFSINIANFEAFFLIFKQTKNLLLFLKSDSITGKAKEVLSDHRYHVHEEKISLHFYWIFGR